MPEIHILKVMFLCNNVLTENPKEYNELGNHHQATNKNLQE